MWCPDTLLVSVCFQLNVFSEPAVVCVFVSLQYLKYLVGIHVSFSVCARLWQSIPQVMKCLLLSLVPSSIADDPSSCIEGKVICQFPSPLSCLLMVSLSHLLPRKKSWHAQLSLVAAAAYFDHPCFFLWTFPNEGPKVVCCMEGQACHWWAVSGKTVY